jgi:transposase
MDTSGAKRQHKRWPEALKREIVAATLRPGASVSVVARQYDVNANQVFSWRRRYREAGEPSPPSSSTSGLLPVTVMREPEDEPAAPPTLAASDTIEIEVSGTYRVRVGSGFDPRSLKRVLDVLRRR